MTGRGAELRRAFVERARELGATLEPSDLALAFAPVPGSPGDRIVVAAWGAGGSENAASGLLREGEAPVLDPTRALALLAGVWGGRRPAADVSDAVALLLDPLGRREVLRSGGDVAGWRADDGGAVAAPGSLLGADGRLAEVRFWWCRGAEAREVVVGFAPDGSVTVGGGRVARREGVAP